MNDPQSDGRTPRSTLQTSIDRRTFLKHVAVVAGASTAIGLAGGFYGPKILKSLQHPWDARAFPPPGTPPVAVVRAASYETDLEGTILDGLREIGADVAGRSVFLKPNVVDFDPTGAINTDLRLVAATVLAMRRLGAASVSVGDGPALRRDGQFIVTSSGLLDALRAVGAPFVDLNTAELRKRVLHSSFSSLKELWLPSAVVESDVVVSMPKLKTHHWAGATLSMKNCFGCVPGRVYGWPKNVLHWSGLSETIVDVAAAIRPSIQIVDGILGMEGNGPIQGTPIRAGVLVFGTDPVATDTTAARLMELDPTRMPYISNAARFLGQGDFEKIRQVGEDPEALAVNFRVIPAFAGLKMGSDAGAGSGAGNGVNAGNA